MEVEIWSDVMCPFCYIGKRHIEKAMNDLPFKNEIKIAWKSYQLNPGYHNTAQEDLYTYLARTKGISIAQVKHMTSGVTQMARNVGLEIDFERNIPANSFNAHRLIHLAKSKGLQNEAEESLFKAHFIDAKDIAEEKFLLAIAAVIGLDVTAAKTVLQGQAYAEQVRNDIEEAQKIGVKGVPYFVFDHKYALSGAQPIQVFTQALVQSFTEWQAQQSSAS